MRTFPPTHRFVRKGRRPSVAHTTERRSPSARKRSGAGFLPARPSAARVVLRRARAEAFRVYGEDEFFAPGGPCGELVAEPADREDGPSGSLRAATGLALVGVSVALILAFALKA